MHNIKGRDCLFWQRLVSLCNQNGISPSKLAEKLGLSNATPVRWKRGSIPQARILYRIAVYFGVTTSYLLGETDVKTPIQQHEGSPALDDFTYAMQNEAATLTDEQKKMLLEMARFLKDKEGK